MFKWVPYSQRSLVLGLVGLVGLVGLALWLVSGIALNVHGFFPVINGLYINHRMFSDSSITNFLLILTVKQL